MGALAQVQELANGESANGAEPRESEPGELSNQTAGHGENRGRTGEVVTKRSTIQLTGLERTTRRPLTTKTRGKDPTRPIPAREKMRIHACSPST